MDPRLIHPDAGPSGSSGPLSQPLYHPSHDQDAEIPFDGVVAPNDISISLTKPDVKTRSKPRKFEREPGKTQLPQARVQKILKADKEMSTVAKDALHLISVATEEFIRRLVQAGHQVAVREKRSTVQHRDLATAVRRADYDELSFLEEVIPPAISLSKALELARRIDPDDPYADPPAPDYAIIKRPMSKDKGKAKTPMVNGSAHAETNSSVAHFATNGAVHTSRSYEHSSRSHDHSSRSHQQPQPQPQHITPHPHSAHHHHHHHVGQSSSHHHPSHPPIAVHHASHSPVTQHYPSIPNGVSFAFPPHGNQPYPAAPDQSYVGDGPMMGYQQSMPPATHVTEFNLGRHRSAPQQSTQGPSAGYSQDYYYNGDADEYGEESLGYGEAGRRGYPSNDPYGYGHPQGIDGYGRGEEQLQANGGHLRGYYDGQRRPG